jgi:molybdenum cofactor cytidylyltransferase
MFFGSVPIKDALGGVAVHSIRTGDLVLKKGTAIGPDEVVALRNAGIGAIVIARMEDGDIGEDAAAAHLAARLAGDHVRVEEAFTGRSNLFATCAGVMQVDRPAIDALNSIHEDVTFATLPALRAVQQGEMIGTVKIIPFAVSGATMAAATAATTRPLIRVAPFRALKVGVISTLLPGLKESVVSKTLKVLAERLAPAGASILAEERVAHEADALRGALERLAQKGADMLIMFGASAIADRRDVIPSAIEAAGGRIEHFGMPVDPGNLLLIGILDGKPVLGAPGCARSPKENGFDWVLQRLLAGIPVLRADIAALGVGGLLMEIVTRPQPRASLAEEERPSVAGIVLAAGRSTRMGGPNKLLEEWNGQPIIRTTVENVLASSASPVLVVTGHQADSVRAALSGLSVTFVSNPDFAKGLSTSVRAGIAAVPAASDGAIICLGDMPGISTAIIDRLIAALEPSTGALAIMPTFGGERGNPIVWARRFFPDLLRLEGDAGARALLRAHAEGVVEVPVASDAVTFDVDTPEALAALRAKPGPD